MSYARQRRSEKIGHRPVNRYRGMTVGSRRLRDAEEVAAASAETAEQFIPRANEKTAGHTSGTP